MQGLRNVWIFHESVMQLDAVQASAEVLDFNPFIVRNVWHRPRFNRHEHDPLMQHLVVGEIVFERRWRLGCRPIHKDGGPWNTRHGEARNILHEFVQRPRLGLYTLREHATASLPRRHGYVNRCRENEW